MKKKITTAFLCVLFLSACAQPNATDELSVENVNNVTSKDASFEVSSLPNNLNSKYQDDLLSLADAPVYTIDFSINKDGDMFRVAGTQEVVFTNTETDQLDEVYFKIIPIGSRLFNIPALFIIDGNQWKKHIQSEDVICINIQTVISTHF